MIRITAVGIKYSEVSKIKKKYPRLTNHLTYRFKGSIFITPIGICKLLINSRPNRKRKLLINLKAYMVTNLNNGTFSINDLCELFDVSRQCIHQFRQYPPKKNPKLALVEGEDYVFFSTKTIMFYPSAITKIKQRINIKRTKRNKKTFIKKTLRQH